MSDKEIDYPIPLPELMKLWLEYAARLHIASIGDDGAAAIEPDTAMIIACGAVAVGASDHMVKRFNQSFLDPFGASESIAKLSEEAFDRATAARAASADRTAKIYATRFGIPDPHPTPSGRA